ncbi:DUF5133 domain-containing protein [Streptomyces sp. NPDC058682]|uniref:DUF5133 domain-containing protein n=1 Tax=Streptomyces sp. NPDC058682 TaxID=3346596 RepID=UPI003660D4CD
MFRDLRRRTFTAPDDPILRARLQDAGYTLCVMLGQRVVHHALVSAEQLVAARRLNATAFHGPDSWGSWPWARPRDHHSLAQDHWPDRGQSQRTLPDRYSFARVGQPHLSPADVHIPTPDHLFAPRRRIRPYLMDSPSHYSPIGRQVVRV